MKNIVFLAILIFIASCTNTTHNNNSNNNCTSYTNNSNSNVIVNVSLISTNDEAFKNKTKHKDTLSYKAYYIKLSIINKSDKPVAFWMMSCAWDDNFIVNNDYVRFNGWVCTVNAPIIQRLKPNDSLVLKASIFTCTSTRYQLIKTTKFGLIYIDESSCNRISDYESIMGDKSKWAKIIWSNPLYLKKETK
jgi:hypothetical protein